MMADSRMASLSRLVAVILSYPCAAFVYCCLSEGADLLRCSQARATLSSALDKPDFT